MVTAPTVPCSRSTVMTARPEDSRAWKAPWSNSMRPAAGGGPGKARMGEAAKSESERMYGKRGIRVDRPEVFMGALPLQRPAQAAGEIPACPRRVDDRDGNRPGETRAVAGSIARLRNSSPGR